MNRYELKDDFTYLCTKYKNYCLIGTYAELAKIPFEERKNYWLMTFENYISIPLFYDISLIKQFKGLITHNKKFFDIYEKELNIHYIEYPQFGDYYKLSSFKTFENKIKGIVCPSKIYPCNSDGSILYLREDFMNNLQTTLVKHIFCNPIEKWSNEKNNVIYQNDFSDPYSEKSLEIKNRYLFTLALEPVYHPLWSYSWITERLLCCFKAKSIALFFGTYNIEDYVPSNLFIDLRKYLISESPKIIFDYKKLNIDLLELANDKERYERIVNNAYDWQLQNKFGDMNKIENQIDKIVNYKEEL
jgi:hypothetical protein